MLLWFLSSSRAAQLEKDFLKNRREGFQRYNAAQIDRPFDQMQHVNAAYCTPAQRFDVDFSVQSKINRQRRIDNKNAQIETLRKTRTDRNTSLAFNMDQEFSNTTQRFETLRDNRSKSKKNMSGISGYNSVSMLYANTREGNELKQKDSRTIERANMRSERLFTRRNGSHNPITGEVQRMPQPNQRSTPSSGNPLW
jgi:hypothetical protein